MDYTPNRAETAQFLLGSDLRRVCTLAAARVLVHAKALCPTDTGGTAGSGRLVHQRAGGINHDRVQVSVTFGGYAVEHQFGNRRTHASRFLTRALELS